MHKRVLLIFLILCVQWLTVVAQINKPNLAAYKTYDAKIKAWKDYCSSLLEEVYSGKSKLNMIIFVRANQQGLRMVKGGDLKNVTYFTYCIGAGYQACGMQDSAVVPLEHAVKNYGKLKLVKDEITAMRMLHYAYFYSGRFARRDTMIWRMEKMLPTVKEPVTRSIILSTLSEYSYDHANYEKAISYKLTAIEEWKKIYAKSKSLQDKSEIGTTYTQIAETYFLMKQYEKELEYLDLAVPYISNNRTSMIYIHSNYLNAYIGLNNITAALKEFNSLKKLASKDDPLYSGFNQAHVGLASYYLQNKDLNTALNHATRALTYAVLSKQPQNLIDASLIMGKVLYERGDYKRAVMHLKKANVNGYNFGRESYAITNQKLAESYAGIKDYENAFKHYKIYAKLQDTLYQEASKKSIAEMDAKYHATANKREIKLLNAENDNKNIELKAASRTRWLMSSAILLSLLVAAAIYKIYKNKQKANLLLDKKNQQLDIINAQLSEANQTKARLFSIISHDLRSPVSQLFTFLNLQQAKPDGMNAEELLRHQQQLIQASTTLLETMEDLLLWSKSQLDNFEIDIEPLDVNTLFNEVIALMAVQTTGKKLHLINQAIACDPIQSDYNLVRTVLRNLVQNAVNNAIPETAILLKCGAMTNGQPYLSVINSAEGITPAKIDQMLSSGQVKSSSSGYGLVIIKELAQRINAELQIGITEANDLEIRLIFSDS